MNHKKTYYLKLILNYFFGDITPSDKLKLEKWIKSSGKNKELFEQLEKLWFSDLKDQKFILNGINTEEAFDEMMDKLNQKALLSSKKTTIRFASVWKVAAVLILILGSVLSILVLQRPSSQSSLALRQFVTQPGKQQILTLSDGTKVWLNGQSTLQYPISFQGSETREVTLQGEAFFEVAKDAQHPFIVNGQKLRIKVLGTRFNFISDDSLNIHQVTVTEGKVQVSPAKKDNALNPVIITHHQRITYSANKLLEHSKVEGLLDVSWNQNTLQIQNMTFSEVVRLLERNHHVKINYPKVMTNYRVNIEIPVSSIDSALFKLQEKITFEAMKIGNQIEIRIPQ